MYSNPVFSIQHPTLLLSCLRRTGPKPRYSGKLVYNIPVGGSLPQRLERAPSPMDRPIHLNQAGHPPDASRDQQHLAPPPVSSASAVSNIGRFEAAGGVGAREEQHRPLKQPQPWSASPRERLHEAGAEAHSQVLYDTLV